MGNSQGPTPGTIGQESLRLCSQSLYQVICGAICIEKTPFSSALPSAVISEGIEDFDSKGKPHGEIDIAARHMKSGCVRNQERADEEDECERQHLG